jgi:Zn-finger nucleic acid-binding protein
MSERQGVEIDYCPSCRGVWLDRGELDKILEKSLENQKVPPVPAEVSRQPSDPYTYSQGYYDDHHKHGHKHWKRKSWLQEIFD